MKFGVIIFPGSNCPVPRLRAPVLGANLGRAIPSVPRSPERTLCAALFGLTTTSPTS
jgi:hypothetical protein